MKKWPVLSTNLVAADLRRLHQNSVELEPAYNGCHGWESSTRESFARGILTPVLAADLPLEVPRLRGPDRLKAELQTWVCAPALRAYLDIRIGDGVNPARSAPVLGRGKVGKPVEVGFMSALGKPTVLRPRTGVLRGGFFKHIHSSK
jgi:hypothetical protein